MSRAASDVLLPGVPRWAAGLQPARASADRGPCRCASRKGPPLPRASRRNFRHRLLSGKIALIHLFTALQAPGVQEVRGPKGPPLAAPHGVHAHALRVAFEEHTVAALQQAGSGLQAQRDAAPRQPPTVQATELEVKLLPAYRALQLPFRGSPRGSLRSSEWPRKRGR